MKNGESKLQVNCHVDIKPMSVNDAWQGRRFKTKQYKKYETDVLFLLPKIKMPRSPLEITFELGMSNSLSDIDNPIKPFTDILQKKYSFNDKDIYRMVIEKKQVEKGKEYIFFSIKSYDN